MVYSDYIIGIGNHSTYVINHNRGIVIMIKKQISIRVDENIIDFLDDIAKTCSISRNAAFALVSDIARDYFSIGQIIAEHGVRGVVDGRRTK